MGKSMIDEMVNGCRAVSSSRYMAFDSGEWSKGGRRVMVNEGKQGISKARCFYLLFLP
jgi:hypothetical protein